MKSAKIQDQINKIDEDIQQGAAGSHLDLLEMQKSDLKKELEAALAEEAQQQDAQAQQQAQAEQIGGLKETLRSIFEAAFPKEETVKLIGLTEYETTQQTYNQLTDQAVDEDQTALYDAFKQQLEQRDEKYRALTSQALDTQNQLDKANATIQSQAEIIVNHEKAIADLTFDAHIDAASLDQKDTEIESLGQQLENAKETIFNLQKQINNVPAAPQIIDITPTKASESLSERIAQAKVASIKQFSNLYSDVTYTDGTKQVVHNSMIPSLEQTLAPLDMPALPATQEVHTFPEVEVQATDGAGNTTSTGNSAQDTLVEQNPAAEENTVTYATKDEHEALAARVARIEAHANLPAVA